MGLKEKLLFIFLAFLGLGFLYYLVLFILDFAAFTVLSDAYAKDYFIMSNCRYLNVKACVFNALAKNISEYYLVQFQMGGSKHLTCVLNGTVVDWTYRHPYNITKIITIYKCKILSFKNITDFQVYCYPIYRDTPVLGLIKSSTYNEILKILESYRK